MSTNNIIFITDDDIPDSITTDEAAKEYITKADLGKAKEAIAYHAFLAGIRWSRENEQE